MRSQIDTLELDALQEIEAVEAQKALQYGAHEWTKVTVKGGNTSDALKQLAASGGAPAQDSVAYPKGRYRGDD